MSDWRRFQGKSVVVQAAGLSYRGVVVELGVENLILRAATGMREIPWERVTRIEEAPAAAPLRKG